MCSCYCVSIQYLYVRDAIGNQEPFFLLFSYNAYRNSIFNAFFFHRKKNHIQYRVYIVYYNWKFAKMVESYNNPCQHSIRMGFINENVLECNAIFFVAVICMES